MNEEHVEFDFSGKSNEEILSLFFHEIRASVSSVVGYLTILKLAGLPEDKVQEFTELALKRAIFVQDHVTKVFEYLDEQRNNQ